MAEVLKNMGILAMIGISSWDLEAKGGKIIDKVLASATEFDLGQSVDFCLLFYVAHEIPQIELAWQNIHKHCRKGAKVYLVEPAFHVSKSEFAQTLRTAQEAGFVVEKRFGLWDRAAILSAE